MGLKKNRSFSLKKKGQKKHTIMTQREKILLVILAVIMVGIVIIFLAKTKGLFNNPLTSKQPINEVVQSEPTATPAPPMPEPLAQGEQIYGIGRGDGSKGPDLFEAIINPFDPKKGEQQTMKIRIKKGSLKTTKVNITLKSDNNAKTYPLTLLNEEADSETWSGSWIIEDTHNWMYKAVVDATDEKDEVAHVEISFR